jgi:lactate 2-monooxygenase
MEEQLTLSTNNAGGHRVYGAFQNELYRGQKKYII